MAMPIAPGKHNKADALERINKTFFCLQNGQDYGTVKIVVF